MTVLITINWGTYIWAVNADHVTESALGYYINPLVSVALGAIFFREKMDTWTRWAVGIAAVGVAVASIMLGRLPWISLVLATSFGLYGLVKKKAGLEPLAGLAAETLIASPFALAFLIARHAAGAGSFGGPDTVGDPDAPPCGHRNGSPPPVLRSGRESHNAHSDRLHTVRVAYLAVRTGPLRLRGEREPSHDRGLRCRHRRARALCAHSGRDAPIRKSMT